MAYELEEDHFEAFRQTFKDDDEKRDRLIDEIYVPCMQDMGESYEVNDDLLTLKERSYTLTHDDDLLNPLYTVKNLAIFAIRHEMPVSLTFVGNPLTVKDSLSIPEAREYIKQFDLAAVSMYSGSLKREIAKEETLIAALYKEGWKYDRKNSRNLFSAINRRLCGRSDKLYFTYINNFKGRKRTKEFKDFTEVYQFHERTKSMAREYVWRLQTPDECEKVFSRVNKLAEDYRPSAEWGVTMSEDRKTVRLYDEDKFEMEDLLEYVQKGLEKPEKEQGKVEINNLAYAAGHIKGGGTIDGKPFVFDYNAPLRSMKLEGADPEQSDRVLREIEKRQEQAREQRQQKEQEKENGKEKTLVRKLL